MVCSYCDTHYEQGTVCPKCNPDVRQPTDGYRWAPIAFGIVLSFVVIVHGAGRAIKDVVMASTPDTVARLVFAFVVSYYLSPKEKGRASRSYAFAAVMYVLALLANFWHAAPLANLREDQSGKYYGVGMTVGPRNNRIIVIAPFAGTPAYRAGLRPGDIIATVDGKSADNMSTTDVVDLLKGPRNTNVRITVLREGSEKPLEFNVVRDEIPRHSDD